MSVPKITSGQFQDEIATGITDRDNTTDVTFGPVPDIAIIPLSQVLEQQNDRLRQVSQLISLENVDQFSDADLDALVFNEGLIRNDGAQAEGEVVFSTAAAPSVDATVQRGFPIATVADEATNKSVTFITTEAKTLPAATASSYFNLTTQRYELSVPVICLTEGENGRVGPNRIRRPLRPLVVFDSVTNPAAVVTGGVASETQTQLSDRYQIAVQGRQLSTPTGIRKYVLDTFPGVTDLETVFGNDPLLVRAATDAGAVDAFAITTSTVQVSAEQHTFLGIGQVIAISIPPLAGVSLVKLGANTLVEGIDYAVTFDDSGNSGSTRALDGITILSTTTQVLVAGSSVFQITYTYDPLIRDMQDAEAQEDVHVFGRDLLYRRGSQVTIVVSANLTTASGFNPATVASFVQAAVASYINGLGLGDTVEAFLVETAAGSVSGVANFAITRLTRSDMPSGISDIVLARNEYPRTTNANVVITPL